jgi:hypothetical protein
MRVATVSRIISGKFWQEVNCFLPVGLDGERGFSKT